MATVTLRVPGSNEPGYLRRMMALAEVQDAVRDDQRDHGDITAGTLMRLIEFLEPFVEVEGEDVEPRDALLDMSENEYDQMMAAFRQNPVPKESETPSSPPTAES